MRRIGQIYTDFYLFFYIRLNPFDPYNLCSIFGSVHILTDEVKKVKTLLRWLKEILKNLPDLAQTLDPARADDVLALDELWSFVRKKSNARWDLDRLVSPHPAGSRLLHGRPQ